MDENVMSGSASGSSRVAIRRAVPWVGAILLLAVLAMALALEAHREIADPGDSDAISFVTGAHLASTDPMQLYSAQAQRRVEAQLLHIPLADGFLNPYPNIGAGALILSPLAHVDLQAATEIAVLASAVLFAVALLLALRLLAPVASRPVRLGIAVAAVLCFPAVEAIFQWDSLMTVALLGSVLLAERRRYVGAGLLLATLILKPQTLWLVVPALIVAQSWRYLGGVLLGSIGWIAVSLAMTGTQGFLAMAKLVAGNYPGQSDSSIGLPSLVSAVTGNGDVGFIAAGCFAVVAIAVLIWRRDLVRGKPVAAVAVGLVLSLLCSPHVTTEDFMLIVVPIALIARRWPLVALAEAAAVSAIEVVQLHLPTGVQHLQPFTLAVIAASTLLAVRQPVVPSVSAMTARRPGLRNSGAGALTT